MIDLQSKFLDWSQALFDDNDDDDDKAIIQIYCYKIRHFAA